MGHVSPFSTPTPPPAASTACVLLVSLCASRRTPAVMRFVSSLTLTLRCCWNFRLFQDGDEALRWRGMSEVHRQVVSLSGQCRSHDEKLGELAASLQRLQARVDQMDGAGVSSWAPDGARPRVKDGSADGRLGSQVMLTSGRVCSF